MYSGRPAASASYFEAELEVLIQNDPAKIARITIALAKIKRLLEWLIYGAFDRIVLLRHKGAPSEPNVAIVHWSYWATCLSLNRMPVHE